MAAMSPYVLLLVLLAALAVALVYAAIDAFRQGLMASRRLVLGILVFLGVLALVAYYYVYVLGWVAAPAAE